MLIVSTTGEHFDYYVLDENLEPQKQNHPSRLQPSVDLITEDYEPALCIVLFVDEAGGSPR